MRDAEKTKSDLLKEVKKLRKQIRELKRAEKAGKTAAGPLKQELIPAIFWTTDRDLRFTSAGGQGLVNLREKADVIVGETFSEYFKTTDPHFPAIAAHQAALEGKEGHYIIEWAGFHFSVQVKPLTDESGRVVGTMGVAVEIKDSLDSEGEIERIRKQLKIQYEDYPVPTYLWCKEGERFILRQYNRAAFEYFGGKIVDFVGEPLDKIHGERADILRDMERCFSEKTTIRREMVFRFRSLEQYRRLMVDYDFLPPCFILVHTEDITLLRRTEEERASLQRLAKRLISSLTIENLARLLADECRNLFEYHAFSFFLFDKERDLLREILTEDTPTGESVPRVVSVVPLRNLDNSRIHALVREPMLLNRREGEPTIELGRIGFRERLSRSMMISQIYREDRIVGCVVVSSYQPDFYSRRDLGILQSLTNLCGGAVTRIMTEEAMREKDLAIDSSSSAIAMVDLEGKLTYANPSFLELWELGEDVVLKRPFSSFWESSRDAANLLEQLKEKGSWKGEMRALLEDGSCFDAQVSATLVKNPLGAPVSIMVYILDVSDQKLSEKALGMAQISIDTSGDAIYWMEPDGRFLYANETACRITGYSFEEFQNMHVFELDPNENETSLRKVWREIKEKGRLFLETTHRTKEGKILPFEVHSHYFQYRGRECICSICRDLSERKKAQRKIHELGQYLESVIDNANVWMDVLDKDANVVIWNKAAERISGYSREEVIGHGRIWEWLYPDEDYRKEITNRAAVIIEGEDSVEDFETTIRCKDGGTRIISWNSRNLVDENGETIGSTAMGRDVTERRRAEEEREALERISHLFTPVLNLEELGHFLGRESRRLFHHDAFWFSRYDAAKNALRGVYIEDTPPGENEPKPVSFEPVLPLEKEYPLFKKRRSRLINRDTDPADTELVAFGYSERLSRSLMFAPVIWEDRIIGVVSVQSYTPGRYVERDLRMLEAFADLCGSALSRMKIQQDLRLKNRAVESSVNAIAIVDLEGRITYINRAFVEMWGYEEEREVLGKPAISFWKDEKEAERIRKELFEKGIFEGTLTARRKDGSFFEVEGSDNMILNEQGRPCCFMALFEDITEKKRAGEALERIQHIYRKAIANTRSVPYYLNFANEAYEFFGEEGGDLLGIPVKELRQEQFTSLVREMAVADPDAPSDPYEYGNSFARGDVDRYQVDYRIVTPAGEEKWLSDCSVPVRDEITGRIIGSLGILRDITGRKRTEEELKRIHGIYRDAIRNASGCPYRLNLETHKYDFFGKEGRDLLELPEGELERIQFSEMVSETRIVDPDAPPVLEDYIHAFQKGDFPHFRADYRILTPSGREIWLNDCAVSVRDEKTGKITGSLGILQDVTFRKQLEREKEILQNLTRELTSVTTLGQMGRLIARKCRALFHHDAFWFSLYDGKRNMLFRGYVEDTPRGEEAPVETSFEETLVLDKMFPLFSEVRGRLINRMEEPGESEFIRFGQEDRLSRSLLFAPVALEKKIYGVVSVQSYTPGFYGEKDLRFLEAMAAQCGSTLARIRGSEQLEIKSRAMDTSINALALVTLAGRVSYANHAFLAMWNYDDMDDVQGYPFVGFWNNPSEASVVLEMLWKEGEWSGEMEARGEADLSFFARISGHMVKTPEGNPLCMMFSFLDVSAERLADQALLLARFSLDGAGEGIVWIDRQGRYFYANEAMERLLGYTHEELVSLGISDVDPGFPEDRIAEIWEDLKTSGHVLKESTLKAKDGSMIPVEVSSNYLRFGEKELNCAFVRDITERKQVEKRIRASERNYRRLIENAGAIISLVRRDGVILMQNRAAAAALGKTPEQCVGKTLEDLFPSPYSGEHLEHIREVIDTGRTFEGETESILKGEKRHYTRTIEPIEDEDGRITSALVIAHDITEGKRIEEDLKKSVKELHYHKMLYQAILRGVPLGICKISRDWTVAWANQSMKNLLDPEGVMPEMEGASFKDFFPSKNEFKEFTALVREGIAGGETPQKRLRLQRGDGSPIDCLATAVRLDPAQTDPGYVITLCPVGKDSAG